MPAITSGRERVRLAVVDRDVRDAVTYFVGDDVAHVSPRGACCRLCEEAGSIARSLGSVQTEVVERGRGRDPAARRPLEQPALQEERFVDVFDGLRRFTDCHRERAEPDRAPGERACTAR